MGLNSFMLKKKKLLTIPEQIAEYVKENIISGRIKVGEKLPSEQALTDLFQVSRPTVRDALKQLSASKLILSKPGARGGHFIAEITTDSIVNNFSEYITLSLGLKGITIDEVIEMRKIVEIKSCYLAAQRRTTKDLEILCKLLPEPNSPLLDHQYYERDFEFHRSIARTTHNQMIEITTDAIALALKPMFILLSGSDQLKNELARELREIYEAIEASDSEKAAEKMEYHLCRFEKESFSMQRDTVFT